MGMILQNIPGVIITSSLLMAASLFLWTFGNSEASCYRPPVPENGEFQPNLKDYPLGSSVEYSCNGTMILSHIRNLTCLNNSNWDNEPPFCDTAVSPLPLFNGTYSFNGQNLVTDASFDGDYKTCMSLSMRWDAFQADLHKRTIVAMIRLTTVSDKNSFSVSLMFNNNGQTKQCACEAKSDSKGTKKTFSCPNCIGERMVILPQGSRTLDLCEVEVFEYKEYSVSCQPLELLAADGTLTYNRTFAFWKCDDGFLPKEIIYLNCSGFDRNKTSHFYCNHKSVKINVDSIQFLVPGAVVVIHIVIIAFIIRRWKRNQLLKAKGLESEEKTSNVYPLEVNNEYTYINFYCDYAKDTSNAAPGKTIHAVDEKGNFQEPVESQKNSGNIMLVECEVYADYSSCDGPVSQNIHKDILGQETNEPNSYDLGNHYSEIP